MHQCIIIGSGPAGLTAAIYAARANLSPLLLTGKDQGQLTLTTTVENFPGFSKGVLGPKLMAEMLAQAKNYGTIIEKATVTELSSTNPLTITTKEKTYTTQTLIIATGATARWLDVPGAATYQSKGIHTCATCDGFFYKNKHIIVLGGGDSACEEALYLANICAHVTIVHRRDKLRASTIMQQRVMKKKNISFAWNSEITTFTGDKQFLTAVELTDTQTNEKKEMPIDAVFLAIGHIPNSSAFSSFITCDDLGYIITDQHMHTNIPGVFACGDIQDKMYRQAITAAGTGAISALEAEKYLQSLE